MKTTDFNKAVNSSVIAENIEKLFDVSVDLTKYTREELEDYRNKLRTRVFQHEGNSKINDLLTKEEYQKDKAMLELLNTRIKEMLGEQMKKLINQMDQLSEAKKAKPDYIDLDGDGNEKEPMKKAAKDAKVKEGAKPDYIDLDGDGNEKEPMKKAAKDAKVKEAKVDEKAVSKAQQQAAGVALAAKKAGKKPAGKGAAAQMAKMPKGELEKFAGTKHKGLPKKKGKKADEDVNELFAFPKGKDPNSQRAANKPRDTLSQRGGRNTPAKGGQGYKDMVRGTGPFGKKAKAQYGINGPKGNLPEEHKPLLPKQKAVADKIWDAERAAGKAAKAAKRQAGTKSPVSETFRKNVAIVNESLARLIVEDEEGKAKAITAASDMVNDFTSWMQRVGNYQTKSMIELADSIRANFGQQEAETFKQAVGPALAATLETLTQQRETISNAVAVLAGEAAPMTPMGAEPGMEPPVEPGIDAAAPDEMNAADELDAFAASDAGAGAGTTGRGIRESAADKKARMIAEQHSIIARLAK